MRRRGVTTEAVTSKNPWLSGAAVIVGSAALAVACSSGPGVVVRPPSGTGPSPASTTIPVSTTAVAPTTVPAVAPKVTVTPATGLSSPATVEVSASGFSPGESLVVTECAAKGSATGMGDCNLEGMQTVTSDANGKVALRFTVVKGPFGANQIVCDASQACLVSVSQATPSPSEEADQKISFS